ncbi:MAG: hypothetical protein F4Y03_18315 [Alphaproteobacteria bacterium]|nr:hypothetical protein [Alphaproteobacteria bacterium]
MTSQTLPKDPDFAFCPAYGPADAPQEIRIVIDGMTGCIPTALVALTLEDAENFCDRLNARLGMDREAWSALAARSMGPAQDGGAAG